MTSLLNTLFCYFASPSPAHLFAIRERRKRGPGTLQTRDRNLPKSCSGDEVGYFAVQITYMKKLRSSHQRCAMKKGVLKNFAK